MRRNARPALSVAAPLTLLLTVALGCGAESSEQSTDAASSESGATGDEDTSAGSVTDPAPADAAAVIDPASMPAAASIVADVDGTSVTFSESDPGADFRCELSEDRVELRYESPEATLGAEFLDGARIGGEAGVFDGTATIVPPTFDRGGGERYSSAGSEDLQVVIDPPYAMITARFTYRESSTDTSSEDVGTATIAATCNDADEEAGSGTEETSGPGTADSDGHAASITVAGTTYDFGALAGEVTCAATMGTYRGSARTEAKGGGTLGFESVVYTPDSPAVAATTDPPYVWLIDDGADVDYVAGPVPGKSSIDPGESRVVDVRVEGSEVTATLELLDRSTGTIVDGVLVASCPL